MKRFFIFAGEASGDLHGARLAEALQEEFPGCSLEGVAGAHMRRQGVVPLLQAEDFEVMGFTDVLKSLPKLWKQFYCVRDAILNTHYDAVILIDYPGFNLRLAKNLRKKGCRGKLVQYISPTVWAHGKGRIDVLESSFDLLLTIYPFESKWYAHTKLPVVYVGNPLMEYAKTHVHDSSWRKEAGLGIQDDFVAIFPGSRAGEIARNLPLQMKAAAMLKREFPSVRFAVSKGHPAAEGQIQATAQACGLRFGEDVVAVAKEHTYDMMLECRSALAKSGTVTLELALRQRPTVVTYKLTSLNKLIAKHVMKVNLPHYCIVNILGEETVFPEFIDSAPTPESVASALIQFYADSHAREECQSKCGRIAELLGDTLSSRKAARAIGELLL